MLDLDQEAVTSWFHALHLSEPDWPPPIRPVETSGDAPTLLVQLGAALNRQAQSSPQDLVADLEEPKTTVPLRSVLAQLGAARLLHILSWLSQGAVPDAPGLVARITAGSSPDARALRAALTAIGKREVLQRLFAPDRIAALAAASAIANKEDEN